MRYYEVKVLKRLRDSTGKIREAGETYVVPENIARAGSSAGLLEIIGEVDGPGAPAPYDPPPQTVRTTVDTDGDGTPDMSVEVEIDLDPIRD